MNFSDIKTKERIGVALLFLILLVSGVILITGEQKPTVEFKQNQPTSSTTAIINSQSSSSTASTTPTKGKLNINKASVEELDTLPGIGAVIAGRIIDYRNKNGSFKTLTELKEVSGIGDAKYEKVKDLISI